MRRTYFAEFAKVLPGSQDRAPLPDREQDGRRHPLRSRRPGFPVAESSDGGCSRRGARAPHRELRRSARRPSRRAERAEPLPSATPRPSLDLLCRAPPAADVGRQDTRLHRARDSPLPPTWRLFPGDASSAGAPAAACTWTLPRSRRPGSMLPTSASGAPSSTPKATWRSVRESTTASRGKTE